MSKQVSIHEHTWSSGAGSRTLLEKDRTIRSPYNQELLGRVALLAINSIRGLMDDECHAVHLSMCRRTLQGLENFTDSGCFLESSAWIGGLNREFSLLLGAAARTLIFYEARRQDAEPILLLLTADTLMRSSKQLGCAGFQLRGMYHCSEQLADIAKHHAKRLATLSWSMLEEPALSGVLLKLLRGERVEHESVRSDSLATLLQSLIELFELSERVQQVSQPLQELRFCVGRLGPFVHAWGRPLSARLNS